VSGITTTSTGPGNTITGGSGIPILMFTSAIIGTGTAMTNAKNTIPKSNFFILLPPLSGFE